ncbi:unnamed protein product [Rangifer tarandus platyrhynchus]|uniref:Uncharacterized protein n=2 Tax=Rangifer tarandus platyrhynchus TaxID=3082113 RepID=A0ACB0EPZ9_RANTA|nr:unnamed protein product [Rangifer tarandus platyrhynchus]CAI9702348.1 unnamed protein product [Rangifer tarandus platyrhynchus]
MCSGPSSVSWDLNLTAESGHVVLTFRDGICTAPPPELTLEPPEELLEPALWTEPCEYLWGKSQRFTDGGSRVNGQHPVWKATTPENSAQRDEWQTVFPAVRCSCTLVLLLGQFVEKVALVLKSHIFVDEIKAQRETATFPLSAVMLLCGRSTSVPQSTNLDHTRGSRNLAMAVRKIEIMRFGKDTAEMMSRLSRASHQGRMMSGCVITGNVNPGHLVQMKTDGPDHTGSPDAIVERDQEGTRGTVRAQPHLGWNVSREALHAITQENAPERDTARPLCK